MLIGIYGKSKHGKDTLGRAIKTVLLAKKNKAIHHFAFANPMKDAILKMCPWVDPDDLFGPSERRATLIQKQFTNTETGELYIDDPITHPIKEDEELTIRDILLFLGKFGRDCNLDFWVLATMWPVKQVMHRGEHVMITDVRFPNEKKAIEDAGGQVIKIFRPGMPPTKISSDESEISLDYCEHFHKIIINNTFDDIMKAANEIVDELF